MATRPRDVRLAAPDWLLAINLATAKALDLMLSPRLLAIADEVIE
jgi:hypothetical protein